jgi:hypothetical protein
MLSWPYDQRGYSSRASTITSPHETDSQLSSFLIQALVKRRKKRTLDLRNFVVTGHVEYTFLYNDKHISVSHACTDCPTTHVK